MNQENIMLRNKIIDNIQILISKNKLEEASELIEQYLVMDNCDSGIICLKGIIAIMKEEFSNAQIILNEAFKFDGNNLDLLYNLGYVYEKLEQYTLAKKCYQLILKKSSDIGLNDEVEQIIKTLEDSGKVDGGSLKSNKVALFVKNGMDGFLEDVQQSLSEFYEVKKIIVTNYSQIDEGMIWADICWFEWCDELVAYASELEIAREKKIVCRVHSYEVFTDYIYKVKWQYIDKVIFVAAHIKNFALSKTNLIDSQTVVIPNGINQSNWTYKERADGYNIAYVGYINYKKGPMLLLQSIKSIVDYDSRYTLYIAGEFQDDRDVLYFEKMIPKLGLENNVFCCGWQTNLDDWLEDKNYIICTSVLESQNLSVMQAMLKGIKPLVHEFVGAELIYEENMRWATLEQLKEKLINGNYQSEEYRNFVTDHYSSALAKVRMNECIDELMIIDQKCSTNLEKGELPLVLIDKNIDLLVDGPEVLVGVLNYNQEQLLPFCLDSILNQKYPNLKVLIIDDASIDNSKRIIEEYKSRYSNIDVIYHKNNSGSGMYGTAEVIECCNSEYLYMIAADDMLYSDESIKKMVEMINYTGNSYDYVYGDIEIINSEGLKTDYWKSVQVDNSDIAKEVFRRFGSGVVPLTAGLYRVDFFRKNNYRLICDPENQVAWDTFNSIKMAELNIKNKYVGDCFLKYRIHDTNISHNSIERVRSLLRILLYIIENYDYISFVTSGSINKSSLEAIEVVKQQYLDMYRDYYYEYLKQRGHTNYKEVVDYIMYLTKAPSGL